MTRIQTNHSTQVWVNQYSGMECDRNDAHAIYFASLLEMRVYRSLLAIPLQILRQRNLLVKPKTANFPPINWCVDFRIYSKSNPSLGHLNIEAKGLCTDSFLLRLQMLEYHQPDEFSRTLIVTANGDVTVPAILRSAVCNKMVIRERDLIAKLIELNY
ncbi:hypothetical protein [Chamaesiphon sp.]|uniref:hypothetical protein n=1 Tax=Chamaesiphon sp. TaxID=2814140 RepID=UPI0035946775